MQFYENGLKIILNFSKSKYRNFPRYDWKKFYKRISKDKNVLNLFSYTWLFSVCAISGGALKVVNVDMVLTTGRTNHHLNNLDTKKSKILPYDILKSWNRIKKKDLMILSLSTPHHFKRKFETW